MMMIHFGDAVMAGVQALACSGNVGVQALACSESNS
jgi:hypothetical protein